MFGPSGRLLWLLLWFSPGGQGGVFLRTFNDAGQRQTKRIRAADALFGWTPYGRTVSGFVHHVGDGCKPMAYSLVTRLGKQVVHSGGVVLVDRGACTFVTKVLNAQEAGASLVLVADSKPPRGKGDEMLRMGDEHDKRGVQVSIPSMFISFEDGLHIRQALARSTAMHPVKISSTWSFAPKGKGTHVDLDVWATSFSPDEFTTRHGGKVIEHNAIHGLSIIARALAPAVKFAPHFRIQAGGRGSPRGRCTRDKRYCVNVKTGATVKDGAAVVAEDLRLLCVAKEAEKFQRSHSGSADLFWGYVDAFNKKCRHATHDAGCSKRIQSSLKIRAGAVEACVLEALKPTASHDDALLALEVESVQSNHVDESPFFLINGKQYYGRFDCDHPISPARCPLLGALCSAFSAAARPYACSSRYWEMPKRDVNWLRSGGIPGKRFGITERPTAAPFGGATQRGTQAPAGHRHAKKKSAAEKNIERLFLSKLGHKRASDAKRDIEDWWNKQTGAPRSESTQPRRPLPGTLDLSRWVFFLLLVIRCACMLLIPLPCHLPFPAPDTPGAHAQPSSALHWCWCCSSLVPWYGFAREMPTASIALWLPPKTTSKTRLSSPATPAELPLNSRTRGDAAPNASSTSDASTLCTSARRVHV